MTLAEQISTGKEKIAVVGLGYISVVMFSLLRYISSTN